MPIGARIWVAALAGSLLVVCAVAGAAQGPPSPEPTLRTKPAAVVRTVLRSGRTPAAVRRYWTAARMRNATPLAPLDAGLAATVAPPSASADSLGRPSRVPAAGIPFRRYEVPDTTASPARTHGRVFFTIGDSNYACSGTVVNSPDQNVVFTAGHCVDDPDGDGWATNWIFVPGYRDGRAPFGEFVATELNSPSGWTDFGYFSYDIGAANVARNAANRTLQAALGGAGRGIAFNQPRNQAFQAWGYPAEKPFDGEKLFVCESAYGGDDPSPDPAGPHAISIGCDMTAGASGGGWVIDGRYLNSVTSFGYDSLPDVLFGPYFGDAAKALYNRVCCTESGATAPPTPPPASDDVPNTLFTAHPPHRTRSHRAYFAFRSTVTGSSFECLYAGGWHACRSPQRFAGLAPGYTYLFKARAVNGAVKDPTPAVWSFRVRG